MVAGGRDLEGQHAEGRGGEGGERESTEGINLALAEIEGHLLA